MVTMFKALAMTGGEWVIYLLVGCSMLAVAVMIDRGILLFREMKQLILVKELFGKISEEEKFDSVPDEFLKLEGCPARVLQAGFSHVSKGVHSVEERMTSASFDEKRRLEQRMMVLGTLGNNAVYIGLFGTVLGVIKAFRDLAEQAGAGPEVVMAGLSEALIATAVGLLVALPSVVAYNVLQKRIKDLLSETDAMSRLLLSHLKSKLRRE